MQKYWPKSILTWLSWRAGAVGSLEEEGTTDDLYRGFSAKGGLEDDLGVLEAAGGDGLVRGGGSLEADANDGAGLAVLMLLLLLLLLQELELLVDERSLSFVLATEI